MTSLNIKKRLLIMWVDENIDSPENKRYLAEIGFKENNQQENYILNYNNTEFNLKITEDIESNCQQDIIKSNKIDLAIAELKKYKFRETIIITSGNLFKDFIILFNKNLNDIFVIPKIIIFSSINRNIFLPENIPNHKFYFYGGKTNNFSVIKKFIELQQKELDIFPEVPHKNVRVRKNDVKFLFSHIGNVVDLIDTFSEILAIKISGNEYDNNFIINILKEFPNEFAYYSLLNYIKDIPDIPSELLAKYYIKLYTIEGGFYKKMKIDLLDDNEDKFKIYISYIKTLFDGLRKNSLKSYIDGDLFSGQIITNKELLDLEEKRKHKQEGLPISVIFSKSFISFSKKKSEAEKFLEGKNAMLILKKPNTIIKFPYNADIKELSDYPQEEEVLVFPLCPLAIDDIEKIENIYYIKLKY